jgi:FKBP-type peptidyl-prolyl cis-trans isomerase 2
LVNDTEFDSSYKRGQPATFEVDRVIKGWTEALQLMPVGSKWQLFIPSNLAYGETGQPRGGIEPNATLIFDVELLSIVDKNADKNKDEKKDEKSGEKKDDKSENRNLWPVERRASPSVALPEHYLTKISPPYAPR